MAGQATGAVQSLWRATAARGAPAEAWAAGAEGAAVVARGGCGSRSRLQLLLEEVFACHEAYNMSRVHSLESLGRAPVHTLSAHLCGLCACSMRTRH